MCLKENEYQCGHCGNIYEKGCTDEEADIEAQENFPDVPEDELEDICDHCYKQMFN